MRFTFAFVAVTGALSAASASILARQSGLPSMFSAPTVYSALTTFLRVQPVLLIA